MRVADDDAPKRTDIWREGKWVDLWSIVHVLSGILIGLGFYFLHFDALPSFFLALLALIMYEMWEVLMQIEETRMNRVTDIIIGMAGFFPAFILLAPSLSRTVLVATFGVIFAVTAVMSIDGWRASQKAAVLKKRIHARYVKERAFLLEQKARLEKKLRRKQIF